MSDSRALIIANGFRQIADADALIVGDGVMTPVGSANDLTLSADGTYVIVDPGNTLDASIIDRVGTIDIGITDATDIEIGRAGQTVTIGGALTIVGVLTAQGTSQFDLDAQFDGDVIFGNADTDTVAFGAGDATGARVGPAASPNMHFVKEVNHTIDIDNTTTVSTPGGALTISPGAGGPTSGAAPGGAGGALNFRGKVGGVGDAVRAAGAGSAVVIAGGDGGTNGGGGGGPGGNIGITAGGGTGAAAGGNLTLDAGTSVSGVKGTASLGLINASAVTVGNSNAVLSLRGSYTDHYLVDNTAAAYELKQGPNVYIEVDTTDGLERLRLGALGGVTVTVPVNKSEPFFVWDGTSNYITVDTITGAERVVLGNGSTQNTNMIDDNRAEAFEVLDGNGDYWLKIDTDTPKIEVGNNGRNPEVEFLGSGETIFNGAALSMVEQAGDPGATANRGKAYTKDDGAGVTELFYQASDGTVTQLTGPAGAQAEQVIVDVSTAEAIAQGAPVAVFNSAGASLVQEAGASSGAGTRLLYFGLAPSPFGVGALAKIVISGEVTVPDAQWDVKPVAADTGKEVFVSPTTGNLTYTEPTGSSQTVQPVGRITFANAVANTTRVTVDRLSSTLLAA